MADAENYSIVDLEAAEGLPLLPISQVSPVTLLPDSLTGKHATLTHSHTHNLHSLRIQILRSSQAHLPWQAAPSPLPSLAACQIRDNDLRSRASARTSSSLRVIQATRHWESLSLKAAIRVAVHWSGPVTSGASVSLAFSPRERRGLR